WRIAFDQLPRLDANGVRFDWLTFDEGYGSKVPFLRGLCLVGQRFVGEVPVSFSVRTEEGGPARRADAVLTAHDAASGARWRPRRGKPGRDQGAGVPGAERPVQGAAAPAARDDGGRTSRGGDPLPPEAQRPGARLTPQAAA